MDLKIEIKELSIQFKNQIIFNNASMLIDNAGFFCIMGRNGCGKTTLLKAILSYVEYDGTINVICDGKKKTGIISYCMADPVIYPEITVFDNLRIVCDDDERIKKLSSRFGVDEILNLKGRYCSAGERQRVCIMRTILEDNPIIFLDEATSHLDDYISEKVLNVLSELSKTKIIVYITHYEKEVATIADKIFKIEDKNIVCKDIKECGGIVESKISTHYYNERILARVLKWRFRWPFAILFIILTILTLLCLSLATLSPSYVYKKYQGEAAYSKYSQVYINPKCNEIYEDVVGQKLIDKIKASNDNYKTAYNLNLNPSSYYRDCWEGVNDSTFFWNVLIDEDLADNDIVMPNQVYNSLKKIKAIEKNYLLFNRIKFNICDVLYYSNWLPNNYVVMNEDTYCSMLYEYFYYELMFGRNYLECNDVTLVSGRFPETDDEIILNSNYNFSDKIEGTTISYYIGDSEELYRFEIVGYFSDVRPKETEFRKKEEAQRRVPFITKESALKDRLSNSYIMSKENANSALYIDSTKLSQEDIKLLLDNDLILANDAWFSAYFAHNYTKNNRSNIAIICNILLIIDVVSIAIYFMLNKEDNKDNYSLMKIMRLPNKKKNKMLKQQSIFFGMLYSIISYGLYVIFDFVIKKSLSSNIKEYIKDVYPYEVKIISNEYRVFFEYGICVILLGIIIQTSMYYYQRSKVIND